MDDDKLYDILYDVKYCEKSVAEAVEEIKVLVNSVVEDAVKTLKPKKSKPCKKCEDNSWAIEAYQQEQRDNFHGDGHW